MDMLAQLSDSLRANASSKELIEFANKTWQQLEQHAAEGPESYKKFQEATLSTALNIAPSDPKLAQRKPSIVVNTHLEASSASFLISTAPVTIHIFRATPSFAAAMSGKQAQKGPQRQGTSHSPAPFRIRWQSCKLTPDTKEQVIMYLDCPAKQVDAVLDAALPNAQACLVEQVLSFVEQHNSVVLARRAAEVSIPGKQKSQQMGRLEDPVLIRSAASHLPAALVSKLTLVQIEETTDQLHAVQSQDSVPVHANVSQQLKHPARQPRRPLIQEVLSP